jgi:histone H3/H4
MLPLAAIERVARKAGVERISREALEELKRLVEEIAEELANEAAELARHAGRKTIRPEDIKLAAGKI